MDRPEIVAVINKVCSKSREVLKRKGTYVLPRPILDLS